MYFFCPCLSDFTQMNIEAEIQLLNSKVDKLWEALQQFPSQIGMASQLQKQPGKKFKRITTKQDIRQALTKYWNTRHPNYKV